MNFYHTCDCDNIYEGLRVDMVLAYMAGNKKKNLEDDQIYSFPHMHKMHDAILFGTRTVKKTLSSSYYTEMDSFLLSFKKETAADARSKGNVDEKSADPISYSLFHLILTWAIDQGNIFLWVWTSLQWNLMATRSISVDPLALHNFSVSEEKFKFFYTADRFIL